nr:hypothetical protein [Kibdelosporangium sp. MJ126-NF4]CEL15155.1 hypothetical protein [Kibdelosporangium sp. MJ126-NF4]CTQ93249.1 hypothetical protein [Kibdelosporangium sp. MJ126-NF4]
MTGYYKYHAQTYKVEDTPDGGWQGHLLDLGTGEFDVDNSLIADVKLARAGNIFRLDEDEFIDETEQARRHFLVGDGPIFALYQTIDSLWDQADVDGREISDQELALIRALRRRTFTLWDEDFARRDAGEPMENTCRERQFGAEASSE